MSDTGYILGIYVSQGTGEVQEVKTPAINIVGIVGTAPGSKVLEPNVPAAFLGKTAALEAVFPKGATGKKGTLYDAVIGVQEQTTARMVLIRAESDSNAHIMKAIDAFLLSKSITGYKPKVLCVPGFGNVNVDAPSVQNTAKTNAVTPKEVVNG